MCQFICGVEEAGNQVEKIFLTGSWNIGEIKETKSMTEKYEMGKWTNG